MGMHMKIVDAGPGNLPDILSYSGKYETLPALWKPFILAASYVFYGYTDARFVLLLFGSTVFNQVMAELLPDAFGPDDLETR